mmetsp:Transcript_5332/g.23780  ORF Transcript_5332/g.23780 Transcript_5332/m.23780 type:complete len:222 (-) Transcript_5332:1210-1875(-)
MKKHHAKREGRRSRSKHRLAPRQRHLPQKRGPIRRRRLRQPVHLHPALQHPQQPRHLVHVQPVVLGQREDELRSERLVRDEQLGSVGDCVGEVQLLGALLRQLHQVLQPRPLELALLEQHLYEPLPQPRVAIGEQPLGHVRVRHLEEPKLWFERHADSLLRQERSDDEREPLRDADRVLVHQLVERGGDGAKVEARQRRRPRILPDGLQRRDDGPDVGAGR